MHALGLHDEAGDLGRPQIHRGGDLGRSQRSLEPVAPILALISLTLLGLAVILATRCGLQHGVGHLSLHAIGEQRGGRGGLGGARPEGHRIGVSQVDALEADRDQV